MNTLGKKAALKAGLGVVIGLLVGVGFMLPAWETPETFLGAHGAWATLLYLLYCALYGAAAVGGQIVYSIERFSITRATLLHFLISVTPLCVLARLLGWFSFADGTFWAVFAVFFAAYAGIWLGYYISYKRKIKRLNASLKAWRSAQRAE